MSNINTQETRSKKGKLMNSQNTNIHSSDKKREHIIVIIFAVLISSPFILLAYIFHYSVPDIIHKGYLLIKAHYLFFTGILGLIIIEIIAIYLKEKKLANLPENSIKDIKNELFKEGDTIKFTCRIKEMKKFSPLNKGPAAEISGASVAFPIGGGGGFPSIFQKITVTYVLEQGEDIITAEERRRYDDTLKWKVHDTVTVVGKILNNNKIRVVKITKI